MCLYGSKLVGFGSAASVAGRAIAEAGAPRGWSASEALWAGVGQLLNATGARIGLIAVLDVCGKRVAIVDVEQDVPSYGGLEWVLAAA